MDEPTQALLHNDGDTALNVSEINGDAPSHKNPEGLSEPAACPPTIKNTSPIKKRKTSFLTFANSTTIAADREYHQTSTQDVMNRMRANNANKERAVTRNYGAVTNPEMELLLHDYVIEVPKSGTIYKDEFMAPVYLPSKTEPSDPFDIPSKYMSSQDADFSSSMSLKLAPAVRSMVYCSDKMTAQKQDELQSSSSSSGRGGATVDRRNSTSSMTGGGSKSYYGLTFDANFECGNLLKAESVFRRGASMGSAEEYDLYLQADPVLNPSAASTSLLEPDLSSLPAHHFKRQYKSKTTDAIGGSGAGAAQWFFFRIQNTKQRKYRFNICNMSGPQQCITDGMRPVIISQAEYEISKTGWNRVGENISFTKNGLQHHGNKNEVPDSYTWSFTIEFAHVRDTVYMAFAPPYSYTQLQNLIHNLHQDKLCSVHLSTQTMCRTLAGNKLEMLVITHRKELKKLPEDGGFVPTKGAGKRGFAASAMKGRSSGSYDGSNKNAVDVDISDKNSVPHAPHRGTVSISSFAAGVVNPTNQNVATVSSSPSSDSAIVLAAAVAAAATASSSSKNTPFTPGDDTETPGFSANAVPVKTTAIPEEKDVMANKFLLKFQKRMEKELTELDAERERNGRKRAVVISARTHGGETASSWACEGIIRFLLGNSHTAQQLRRHFVFYIIPMVNPDGVVNGFQRTNLAAFDLYRCWKACPSSVLQPTIYQLKKLVTTLRRSGILAAYIDLHENSSADGGAIFQGSLLASHLENTARRKGSDNAKGDGTGESKDIINNNNEHSAVPTTAYKEKPQDKGMGHILSSTDPRALVLAIAKRTALVNLIESSFASPEVLAMDKRFIGRVVVAQESTTYFAKQLSRFPMRKHPSPPMSLTISLSQYHGPSDTQYGMRQLTPTDYARFGCFLCQGLADISQMSTFDKSSNIIGSLAAVSTKNAPSVAPSSFEKSEAVAFSVEDQATIENLASEITNDQRKISRESVNASDNVAYGDEHELAVDEVNANKAPQMPLSSLALAPTGSKKATAARLKIYDDSDEEEPGSADAGEHERPPVETQGVPAAGAGAAAGSAAPQSRLSWNEKRNRAEVMWEQRFDSDLMSLGYCDGRIESVSEIRREYEEEQEELALLHRDEMDDEEEGEGQAHKKKDMNGEKLQEKKFVPTDSDTLTTKTSHVATNANTLTSAGNDGKKEEEEEEEEESDGEKMVDDYDEFSSDPKYTAMHAMRERVGKYLRRAHELGLFSEHATVGGGGGGGVGGQYAMESGGNGASGGDANDSGAQESPVTTARSHAPRIRRQVALSPSLSIVPQPNECRLRPHDPMHHKDGVGRDDQQTGESVETKLQVVTNEKVGTSSKSIADDILPTKAASSALPVSRVGESQEASSVKIDFSNMTLGAPSEKAIQGKSLGKPRGAVSFYLPRNTAAVDLSAPAPPPVRADVTASSSMTAPAEGTHAPNGAHVSGAAIDNNDNKSRGNNEILQNSVSHQQHHHHPAPPTNPKASNSSSSAAVGGRKNSISTSAGKSAESIRSSSRGKVGVSASSSSASSSSSSSPAASASAASSSLSSSPRRRQPSISHKLKNSRGVKSGSPRGAMMTTTTEESDEASESKDRIDDTLAQITNGTESTIGSSQVTGSLGTDGGDNGAYMTSISTKKPLSVSNKASSVIISKSGQPRVTESTLKSAPSSAGGLSGLHRVESGNRRSSNSSGGGGGGTSASDRNSIANKSNKPRSANGAPSADRSGSVVSGSAAEFAARKIEAELASEAAKRWSEGFGRKPSSSGSPQLNAASTIAAANGELYVNGEPTPADSSGGAKAEDDVASGRKASQPIIISTRRARIAPPVSPLPQAGLNGDDGGLGDSDEFDEYGNRRGKSGSMSARDSRSDGGAYGRGGRRSRDGSLEREGLPPWRPSSAGMSGFGQARALPRQHPPAMSSQEEIDERARKSRERKAQRAYQLRLAVQEKVLFDLGIDYNLLFGSPMELLTGDASIAEDVNHNHTSTLSGSVAQNNPGSERETMATSSSAAAAAAAAKGPGSAGPTAIVYSTGFPSRTIFLDEWVRATKSAARAELNAASAAVKGVGSIRSPRENPVLAEYMLSQYVEHVKKELKQSVRDASFVSVAGTGTSTDSAAAYGERLGALYNASETTSSQMLDEHNTALHPAIHHYHEGVGVDGFATPQNDNTEQTSHSVGSTLDIMGGRPYHRIISGTSAIAVLDRKEGNNSPRRGMDEESEEEEEEVSNELILGIIKYVLDANSKSKNSSSSSSRSKYHDVNSTTAALSSSLGEQHSTLTGECRSNTSAVYRTTNSSKSPRREEERAANNTTADVSLASAADYTIDAGTHALMPVVGKAVSSQRQRLEEASSSTSVNGGGGMTNVRDAIKEELSAVLSLALTAKEQQLMKERQLLAQKAAYSKEFHAQHSPIHQTEQHYKLVEQQQQQLLKIKQTRQYITPHDAAELNKQYAMEAAAMHSIEREARKKMNNKAKKMRKLRSQYSYSTGWASNGDITERDYERQHDEEVWGEQTMCDENGAAAAAAAAVTDIEINMKIRMRSITEGTIDETNDEEWTKDKDKDKADRTMRITDDHLTGESGVETIKLLNQYGNQYEMETSTAAAAAASAVDVDTAQLGLRLGAEYVARSTPSHSALLNGSIGVLHHMKKSPQVNAKNATATPSFGAKGTAAAAAEEKEDYEEEEEEGEGADNIRHRSKKIGWGWLTQNPDQHIMGEYQRDVERFKNYHENRVLPLAGGHVSRQMINHASPVPPAAAVGGITRTGTVSRKTSEDNAAGESANNPIRGLSVSSQKQQQQQHLQQRHPLYVLDESLSLPSSTEMAVQQGKSRAAAARAEALVSVRHTLQSAMDCSNVFSDDLPAYNISTVGEFHFPVVSGSDTASSGPTKDGTGTGVTKKLATVNLNAFIDKQRHLSHPLSGESVFSAISALSESDFFSGKPVAILKPQTQQDRNPSSIEPTTAAGSDLATGVAAVLVPPAEALPTAAAAVGGSTPLSFYDTKAMLSKTRENSQYHNQPKSKVVEPNNNSKKNLNANVYKVPLRPTAPPSSNNNNNNQKYSNSNSATHRLHVQMVMSKDGQEEEEGNEEEKDKEQRVNAEDKNKIKIKNNNVVLEDRAHFAVMNISSSSSSSFPEDHHRGSPTRKSPISFNEVIFDANTRLQSHDTRPLTSFLDNTTDQSTTVVRNRTNCAFSPHVDVDLTQLNGPVVVPSVHSERKHENAAAVALVHSITAAAKSSFVAHRASKEESTTIAKHRGLDEDNRPDEIIAGYNRRHFDNNNNNNCDNDSGAAAVTGLALVRPAHVINDNGSVGTELTPLQVLVAPAAVLQSPAATADSRHKYIKGNAEEKESSAAQVVSSALLKFYKSKPTNPKMQLQPQQPIDLTQQFQPTTYHTQKSGASAAQPPHNSSNPPASNNKGFRGGRKIKPPPK